MKTIEIKFSEKAKNNAKQGDLELLFLELKDKLEESNINLKIN